MLIINHLCSIVLTEFGLLLQLYEEAKGTMAKEREEIVSLEDKMSKLESQLKEKGQTIGEFTNSVVVMN